jgi:hypothetical protein
MAHSASATASLLHHCLQRAGSGEPEPDIMFIATADLRMLHARDVAERTGAGGAAASGLKTDSDIAAGSRALHGRELQQAASSWLTPPPDELDGGLGECAATPTAGADLDGVAAVASMLASMRGGE